MENYTSNKIYRMVGAFALFFACASAQSQSLSFSQVLVISNVEDTVPAGKVWKIESILTEYQYQYSAGASCINDDDARQIQVNGVIKYIQSVAGTGATNVYFGGNSLPFWLPAGYRLKTSCSQTLVSVLEFTVTP